MVSYTGTMLTTKNFLEKKNLKICLIINYLKLLTN